MLKFQSAGTIVIGSWILKMWKMSFNIIMDVENDESVKMRTPRKMRELSGHHLAFEIMDVENEKKI